MDETNIKVKGRWRYLYRAVDKAGDTIDFLFRAKRDKAAARRFFQKAMAQNGTTETVTIDKSGSNLAALHAVLPSARRPSGFVKQSIEQRGRPGPSGYQTPHSADAGVQGL